MGRSTSAHASRHQPKLLTKELEIADTLLDGGELFTNEHEEPRPQRAAGYGAVQRFRQGLEAPQGQPERPRPADEPQSIYAGCVIMSITREPAPWGRHDANRLVVANRLRGHAGDLRDLSDREGSRHLSRLPRSLDVGTIDLPVSGRSRGCGRSVCYYQRGGTEGLVLTVNPFADTGPHGDDELVGRAQAGDRDAVDELVRRHQTWVYNIALRMLAHPHDAQDATQDILIKVVLRLGSFEGRSRFRTWLYRIVVNHVLNMKRGRAEPEAMTFSCYSHGLDGTPDLDLADEGSAPADLRLLVDEARLTCTSGMLLCLDRGQRVVYILGEIFGVSDVVGAELLEIQPENFRQRLARARRDLHSFMNDKCGLVNSANPCRCAKKTRGFIQAGHVDPKNLLFVRERICKVREAAPKTYQTIKTLDDKCAEIYRGHPFYRPPDLVQMVRKLVLSPALP